jgi:hypothetical protein
LPPGRCWWSSRRTIWTLPCFFFKEDQQLKKRRKGAHKKTKKG